MTKTEDRSPAIRRTPNGSAAERVNSVIQTHQLTKRYGAVLALDNLTIEARDGEVTGFLGPNGAGKSTTMRLVVELDRPTSGYALVNGQHYSHYRDPLQQAGTLLDARSMNPGRKARSQLLATAATHGIRASRVDEVLDLVGLGDARHRRVGTFSVGMTQRLGLARALLANPRALILDEPTNGLDPEGVSWLRVFLRGQAAEGKAVFLSSHLIGEVAQVADRVIILRAGRLLAEKTTRELIADASGVGALFRSDHATELADALAGDGVRLETRSPGVVEVHGRSTSEVAQIAASRGWILTELTPLELSLEDAYFRLVESPGGGPESQLASRHGTHGRESEHDQHA